VGEDWGQLTNALADLSWLVGSAFVVLIPDAPLLLSADRTEHDFRQFVQTMTTVNEVWAEQYHMGANGQPRATAFNVLFGCLDLEVTTMTRRVANAGGVVATIA
jgi:hypothetical protein